MTLLNKGITPYRPIHPGEIILDEMEYAGITVEHLAQSMGIEIKEVQAIIDCKAPVTYEFASLYEAATHIPATPLLRMQSQYDEIKARNSKSFLAKLKAVKPIAASL